jgi:hypothetical protein
MADDNTPTTISELSDSQRKAAQRKGVEQAAVEQSKDAAKANDGMLPGEPDNSKQWHGKDDIMQWEGLLDLAPDAFDAAIAEKVEAPSVPVPEEKVAGLLGLERAGRNRTTYVQSMCKRLKVKSPYEVTNAGPAYTNDETPVTALVRP